MALNSEVSGLTEKQEHHGAACGYWGQKLLLMLRDNRSPFHVYPLWWITLDICWDNRGSRLLPSRLLTAAQYKHLAMAGQVAALFCGKTWQAVKSKSLRERSCVFKSFFSFSFLTKRIWCWTRQGRHFDRGYHCYHSHFMHERNTVFLHKAGDSRQQCEMRVFRKVPSS